jgi:hypothetical protein
MIRPPIHIDLYSAWGLVLVFFRDDVCLNLILTHPSVVTIGMALRKAGGRFSVRRCLSVHAALDPNTDSACRTIFGALEGGLFPGCIFRKSKDHIELSFAAVSDIHVVLSCWYTRFEIQKRYWNLCKTS